MRVGYDTAVYTGMDAQVGSRSARKTPDEGNNTSRGDCNEMRAQAGATRRRNDEFGPWPPTNKHETNLLQRGGELVTLLMTSLPTTKHPKPNVPIEQ